MHRIWLLLDSRGLGGIESHVAELAAGLAVAGAPPRVVFLQDHGPHPLRARLDAAGIAWEALPGGLRALRQRLAEARPDVLHTHGYKANLLGRVAARLLGIRVVATFHAGERPSGLLALYDLADRATAFAGGRIAVSRPIQDRQIFSSVLIPNFVRLPDLPGGPRPDSIAFVGRLSPEKGPDLFRALAEAAPGPAYHVYGDGGMRDAISGSTAVTWHGAQPGMEAIWPDIGLLAITSRAEGLPLAALEAMARGIPVAAFAVGGLPDLIQHGENGFLAPPGDVAPLAAQVRTWHAMTAEQRAAMGQAARQTIARNYNVETATTRTMAVYADRPCN